MAGVSPPALLVVNSGSSSLKFALFDGESLRIRGSIAPLTPSGVGASFVTLSTDATKTELESSSHELAIEWLSRWTETETNGHLWAIVHRVVHGGPQFAKPVVVDDSVLSVLRSYIPFAPLHQGDNLLAIELFRRQMPEVTQIACFDSAFHSSLPLREAMYPLPREFYAKGIRKYGFHGLSYESIASQLRAMNTIDGGSVVAHLGSGASVCALQDGESVATSMGFTPLEGVPMGTRSGSIDPGLILYWLETGSTPEALQDLLYKRSGLLGISERSSEMRELVASADAKAQEAIEIFCYRVAREMASQVAALPTLDRIVFTGGIGEHSPQIRNRIVGFLSPLGVELDGTANSDGATRISSPRSRCPVFVLPADEESVMVRYGIGLRRV